MPVVRCTAVLFAAAALVGGCGDDDPGEGDARAIDEQAAASTMMTVEGGTSVDPIAAGVAADIGCDAVRAPTRADLTGEPFPNWPFAGSFDCYVAGAFYVRVHSFDDADDQAATIAAFSHRYAPGSLSGTCDTLDPVLVEGEPWVVIAMSEDIATEAADATSGRVRPPQEHGPFISYIPQLPCG